MEKIVNDIKTATTNPVILYKGIRWNEVSAFVTDNGLEGKVNILRIEESGAWSVTMNHQWLEAAANGKTQIYVWAEPSEVTGVLKDELMKLYHQKIVYRPIFGNWQPKEWFGLAQCKFVDGVLTTTMVMEKDGSGVKRFPSYGEAQAYSLFLGAGNTFQVQKFATA